MAKKTKEKIDKDLIDDTEQDVTDKEEDTPPALAKDNTEKMQSALREIRTKFGDDSIMMLGEKPKVGIDAIPSGSIGLDAALGIGGYPRGRIIEIFGPESSGKTTLAISAIAQAQKLGGNCAFIDAEHAFDPEYAKKIGVNLDNLLISQPDNGEQALEICETLVRSNALDIIVVDSVAALVPRAEIEGEMGDSMMGVQARLMSQALRKLTGAVSKSKTILIFINQIRMKIGVMFGNPETTTGGNALKFYSSVRLDIRRKAAIKKGDETIGNNVTVKVVKNKVAPPFKVAEFDLMFGCGIDAEGEIIDLGVTHEIVDKAGSWLSYSGEKMGQGKEGARSFLKNNPKISAEIKKKILASIKVKTDISNAEN
jgi:recombination protein RecA